MQEKTKQDIVAALKGSEISWQEKDLVAVEPIVPDGSTRRFFRLTGAHQKTMICVQPGELDQAALREAAAFYAIGNHLFDQGVPVPRMYGFVPEKGLLLCEDLGETRLYDLVKDEQVSAAVKEQMYAQAVRMLARMQVKGGENFNPEWCADTPRYDQQLMIERESDYFFKAFCTDYLEVSCSLEGARADCLRLAQRAASIQADFFLHRDFQSRNLMVHDAVPRVIDFQGGRLGPLGYDLASLLIDPYVGCTPQQQSELLQVYTEELQLHVPYPLDQLSCEFVLLALQRNLQILGAFAFLSSIRKKVFFRQFIFPALQSLVVLLAKPEAAEYCALKKLTIHCIDRLEKHI